MKIALVTGASSGIGQSICELLLATGWKVYGLCRRKPDLRGDFVWLECDLASQSSIQTAFEQISESQLDVLVSNAGVAYRDDATAIDSEAYARTFSINVLAPMLIIGCLHRKLEHATIISVSSVSDRIAEKGLSLYCSSKAANTFYFDTLALELPTAKVITLLPDYVDTPMLRATEDNPSFDWSAVIAVEDIGRFMYDTITTTSELPSGANIIIVSKALEHDLQSVEKLYGYITDTRELRKL